MNDQIHEQLSALMDGELERDQTRFLLKRINGDAELPLRWARYHVTRQTLRGQPLVLCAGFAEAVMAQLDQEQVLHVRGRHAWLRWGAGGAIAASVAVAALVLTRPGVDPGASPGASIARSTAVAGGSIGATVASARTSSTFQTPMLAPNVPVETAPASFGNDLAEPVTMEPRMQPYLIRHYQATGATGQSSFVPYVLLGAPMRDNATQTAQPISPNH
ncbi:MAG: sigma-E factor negative regulatory protein [Dokdonella sp.]